VIVLVPVGSNMEFGISDLSIGDSTGGQSMQRNFYVKNYALFLVSVNTVLLNSTA